MKRAHAVVVALSVGLMGSASPSGATYTLFQHGGQGTAQVGAFTARAEGAAAVHYNPAALARTSGRQVQLGIDFTAPRDDFESLAGEAPANHVITLAPAVYASWGLGDSPLALGLGLDSEAWHVLDWNTALFPGRFLTRRQEVTVLDLHPVVAYRLSDRWSAAVGAHYYRGTLGFGDNRIADIEGTGATFPVEVERLAEATADGYGFDLSLHYAAEGGGWGLVLDSGAELDGGGDLTYRPRDVPDDPIVRTTVERRFVPGESVVAFDLPWSARTGFWWAPYPELRIELDFALTGWSGVDSSVLYQPNPFADPAANEVTRERNWDDALSIQLGAEGDLTDHWILSGGLAWLQSPGSGETIEPGFPRGDALVYAIGFGYGFAPYRFDVGYSFHQHDDVTASRQIVGSPSLEATYSARNQVFAFTIGWSRD